MRLPSESPKTTMNSALARIGATIVCDHSLSTRMTSRPDSAISPRRAAIREDTRLRLAAAPNGQAERAGARAARAQPDADARPAAPELVAGVEALDGLAAGAARAAEGRAAQDVGRR